MQGFVEASHLLSPKSGVYALYLGDTLQYIGKSTDVPFRVMTHKRAGKIPFNRVMVRWCNPHELDAIEFTLISAHRPPYNVRGLGTGLAITIDLAALGIRGRRKL